MRVRASKEQGPHESLTNVSGDLNPCLPSNIEIELIKVDPMLQCSECFMVWVHAHVVYYEYNVCALKLPHTLHQTQCLCYKQGLRLEPEQVAARATCNGGPTFCQDS